MTTRKFMGLDLSYSSTGVYVRGEDNSVFSCEVKADKEYDNDIYRVEKVADKIIDIANEHKPIYIMLEDFFSGRQPNTVIMLAILGTMVRYKLLLNNYCFTTCAPTQLKKFVTGKGSGSKDIIIKHIYKKYDIDTDSNNIADAAGLSFLCEAVYKKWKGEECKLLGYEEEVVKKILQERTFYSSSSKVAA